MEKILITGANGQLGRCIRDKVSAIKSENEWYFTDITDIPENKTDYLDLTEENDVENYVVKNEITIIVNCAAYTNVDKAENDYETAEAINAIVPQTLAKIAKKHNLKSLIHISTDYVFNGQTFLAYTEDRMTLPTSVYGKTKVMGEEFIQQSGCKYLIFRTAWLYSEYGNNFVKTMLRLFNEKDELNVVNDQIGTPTYAGNLAKLIVDIVECTEPLEGKETIPMQENGIYHFTDEGVASWYDFTQAIYLDYVLYMYRNSLNKPYPKTARQVEINGVTTKQYGSKTRRPFFSVLDKTKLKTDFKGLYKPRYWRDCVAEVVGKLIK